MGSLSRGSLSSGVSFQGVSVQGGGSLSRVGGSLSPYGNKWAVRILLKCILVLS